MHAHFSQALIQDLKSLSDNCRSNSCIEHATGIMEEEIVPLKLSKGVSTMSLADDKTKVCFHYEICPCKHGIRLALVGHPYDIGCTQLLLIFRLVVLWWPILEVDATILTCRYYSGCLWGFSWCCHLKFTFYNHGAFL